MIHIVVATLTLITCHIPLCLVSRADVTDTTSYFRGFPWTLLGEHAGRDLMLIVDMRAPREHVIKRSIHK